MVLWHISRLMGLPSSWLFVRNYSAHESTADLCEPLWLPPPECGKVTRTTTSYQGQGEGHVPVRAWESYKECMIFLAIVSPPPKTTFCASMMKIRGLFILVYESQALLYNTLIQGNNDYLLFACSPSISGHLERI